MGASFPPSEGKRDSLGATIYVAFKMQTVGQSCRDICIRTRFLVLFVTMSSLRWSTGHKQLWTEPEYLVFLALGLHTVITNVRNFTFEGGVLKLLRQEQILLLPFPSISIHKQGFCGGVFAGISFRSVHSWISISLNKSVVVWLML